MADFEKISLCICETRFRYNCVLSQLLHLHAFIGTINQGLARAMHKLGASELESAYIAAKAGRGVSAGTRPTWSRNVTSYGPDGSGTRT